jgi:hypothetical protein
VLWRTLSDTDYQYKKSTHRANFCIYNASRCEPHRRRQIGVPGKLLNGLRRRSAQRQMRAERVAKDVKPSGRLQASPLLRRLEEVAQKGGACEPP